MVFPMDDSMLCIEDNCRGEFTIQEWYSMKQTLTRHLNDYHSIDKREIEVIKWCSICGSTLGHNLPKHHCFLTTPMTGSKDSAKHKYPCGFCSRSFPTTTGLKSHERVAHYHYRRNSPPPRFNRPRRDAASNIIAQAQPSNDNLQPATTQHLDAHAATVNDSQALPDSQPVFTDSVASNTTATQESTPGRLTQDDNTEGNDLTYVNTDDNVGWEQASEELIPNPDAPAPSDRFLPRFRDLLESFSLDKWDEFEEAVADFVEFAQNHVGIKKDGPKRPGGAPPPDKNDPIAMQRLYRRNRKRALRIITNDTSNRCNVSRERLVQHFYSGAAPPVDLSIFDDSPECSNTPDTSPFSAAEKKSRVKSFDNTAPGPD